MANIQEPFIIVKHDMAALIFVNLNVLSQKL